MRRDQQAIKMLLCHPALHHHFQDTLGTGAQECDPVVPIFQCRVRIQVDFAVPRKVPYVLRNGVLKLDRSVPSAIQSDSEAVVVQLRDFGVGRGAKECETTEK